MKKRILLIIAFGISFTPAVFAAGPLGRPVVAPHTGQLKYSELMDTNPQAAGCNLRGKQYGQQAAYDAGSSSSNSLSASASAKTK